MPINFLWIVDLIQENLNSLIIILLRRWMFIRSVKVCCSTVASLISYWTYRSRIVSRKVLSATLTVWGQISSWCAMKRSLVQRFQKSQLSRSALLSLYNFWRLSINVRSYEIWTTSRWWYVWNSDFKFDMTCEESKRVLSNFNTTLSWLGARSYVVMLSWYWYYLDCVSESRGRSRCPAIKSSSCISCHAL